MTTTAAPATKPIPVAPGGAPFLGHLIPLLRHAMPFLQSLRGVGDIVQVNVGTMPVYVVNSHDLITEMLVAPSGTFTKGRLFEVIRPAMGDSIFSCEGDYHLKQRRLLYPLFTYEQLAGWAETMHECAQSKARAWRPGQNLKLLCETHDLAHEIAIRTIFGARVTPQENERFQQLFPILTKGFARLVITPDWMANLPMLGTRKYKQAGADIRALVDDIVTLHRTDTAMFDDMISKFCAVSGEGGYRMNDAQVRDESVALMMASVASTATLMAWLLYQVGRNPQIEARLREESARVLGGRACTIDDLREMPYLNNAINETMRLHHPLWLLTRCASRELQMGGMTLPERSDLIYCTPGLHRDPLIYPDPMRFDPDRWTDCRAQKVPRHAFLPFAAGRHKCIGEGYALAELGIIIATIMQRWRLIPASAKPVRETTAMAVLQPVGLRMKVQEV